MARCTYLFNSMYTCERGACPLSKLKRYFIDHAKKWEKLCWSPITWYTVQWTITLHFFATTISIKSNAKSWPGAMLWIYPSPFKTGPFFIHEKLKTHSISMKQEVSKKEFLHATSNKTTLMSGQYVLRLLTSPKTRREQNQQQWSSQIKLAKRVTSAFGPAATWVALRQKKMFKVKLYRTTF